MTRLEITNLAGEDLAIGNPDGYGRAFMIPKKGITMDLEDSEFLHITPQLNILRADLKLHYKMERIVEVGGIVHRKEADAERAKADFERAGAELEVKEAEAKRAQKAQDKDIKLTKQEEDEKLKEAARLKGLEDAGRHAK